MIIMGVTSNSKKKRNIIFKIYFSPVKAVATLNLILLFYLVMFCYIAYLCHFFKPTPYY